MDFIRHGSNEVLQKYLCNFTIGLIMKLDISKLRSSINANKHIKLAFFRTNFGDVNMEVANCIFFELLFIRCSLGFR